MKRIAALLLTLCLLVSMPMLIRAEETTGDTFEVSHVVEMPDWMAQNEADKGRTLLLYFNSDPKTAPPSNWRYFIGTFLGDNVIHDTLRWGKYNSAYNFKNNNPIAITMMTQADANASGYSGPNGNGYDGTLQEFYNSKQPMTNRTLKVIIADGQGTPNPWDGYMQGNFANANGTKIKSNRVAEDGSPIRQNGISYLTPAVEEALTMGKVIKTGDNTITAEFSEPINTAGFGTTWGISLNVTNDNGDMMQTQTEGVYDGNNGSASTFYQKDAISIEPEAEGSSRYVIRFNEGDIAQIQEWLDNCIKVKGNFRTLRLRIYDKTEKTNCFIDSITAAADGNPLLMNWKRVANGVTNIKVLDHEFYGIMEATVQGGARCSTLEKALAAAAGTGKTVYVETDLIKEMVKVPAGVTLDLFEHELTTDILVSFGNVIDGSQGKGKLITSKDETKSILHLQANNSAIPLYDTDGYRFFSYKVTNAGVKDHETDPEKIAKDTVKFGIKLSFDDKKAYELLAADAEQVTALTLKLAVVDQEFYIVFKQSTMKKLLDSVTITTEENPTPWESRGNKVITLTVSGLGSLKSGDVLTADPALYGAGGVMKTCGTMTYTYAPAVEG